MRDRGTENEAEERDTESIEIERRNRAGKKRKGGQIKHRLKYTNIIHRLNYTALCQCTCRLTMNPCIIAAFAPSFAKRPLFANQFSTIKGNTTILCQPEAAPTPTIVWYKNGKLLNPSSDAGAVVRQMPNGNLFISPVSSQHAGVYKCEATNTMGEAQSTGNLTVLGEWGCPFVRPSVNISVCLSVCLSVSPFFSKHHE